MYVWTTGLFEEGVTSVLHAKKALELLESRNGLYVLYMDRVIGDLGKKSGQISLVHTLNLDILANLLRWSMIFTKQHSIQQCK